MGAYKTIFVLSHANFKPGGFETIEEYFRDNGFKIIRLRHPLEDYSKFNSNLQLDESEREIKRKSRGVFNLFEDFHLSVKYIRKLKFDNFIGASNFDVIPAIFARKFLRKKIHKIIYIPRDYSEDRYKNKILNLIYYKVEKWAVKGSDHTISHTYRAEKKRLGHGLKKSNSIVIPNSVAIKNPKFTKKKINKRNFIFVGDVSKEHGLYDLIKAISPLMDKLVIIGGGPDWDRTIKLAKNQKFDLELHHAKPRKFVLEKLVDFDGIGLAPYNMTSKWTYYCSPLKVGEYIVSGLPVLMSSVPEMAQKVDEIGAGITYDKLDLAEIDKKLDKFDTSNFFRKSKKFFDYVDMKKNLLLVKDLL